VNIANFKTKCDFYIKEFTDKATKLEEVMFKRKGKKSDSDDDDSGDTMNGTV
jgi:hypothetical protein